MERWGRMGKSLKDHLHVQLMFQEAVQVHFPLVHYIFMFRIVGINLHIEETRQSKREGDG